MAIDITTLKENQSIKYIGEAWDLKNNVHFTVGENYRLYTFQSVYPTAENLHDADELIVWCDEISIHLIKDLTPSDWELVEELITG